MFLCYENKTTLRNRIIKYETCKRLAWVLLFQTCVYKWYNINQYTVSAFWVFCSFLLHPAFTSRPEAILELIKVTIFFCVLNGIFFQTGSFLSKMVILVSKWQFSYQNGNFLTKMGIFLPKWEYCSRYGNIFSELFSFWN